MAKNTIQNEPTVSSVSEKKFSDKSIKISLRSAAIILIIIVLAILGYSYKNLFVAATVNGSPISRLSIIQKLEKTAGKAMLDSIIAEKLIRDEGVAKNITVSENEINEEIKKIGDQIATQGSTIDAALTERGMSMEDLKTQIFLQKTLEQILANKINITSEEIGQYILNNQVEIPEGQEQTINDRIREQLRSQKLDTEIKNLIESLKDKADIKYYVKY